MDGGWIVDGQWMVDGWMMDGQTVSGQMDQGWMDGWMDNEGICDITKEEEEKTTEDFIPTIIAYT